MGAGRSKSLGSETHLSLWHDGVSLSLSAPENKFTTAVAETSHVYSIAPKTETGVVSYFEVTLSKKAADTYFYIGFCDAGSIPKIQDLPPGMYPNSFALERSGHLVQYNEQKHEGYAAPFGEGDTIGAGIGFDSFNQRRIFFTLNGKMLGFALQFSSIAHGMDAVPLVSTDGNVELLANFSGAATAWKALDALKTINMAPHKDNYIGSTSEDALKLILSFAAETRHEAALSLPFVCKQWRDISQSNEIWKPLYFKLWKHQNPSLKVKNWKLFFRRRFEKFGDSRDPEFQIENCSFEFECPMDSRQLRNGMRETEKFCDKCQQAVVLVSSSEALTQAVRLGQCVALAILKRPMMMGRIKRTNMNL